VGDELRFESRPDYEASAADDHVRETLSTNTGRPSRRARQYPIAYRAWPRYLSTDPQHRCG
jgi:hypothetical protein